jgi:arsenical pump membrane protein
MLIGLDLGPNLAVTGSLSAILWLQVARRAGSHPSVTRYTRLGAVVVPVTIGLALAALRLFIPPSF